MNNICYADYSNVYININMSNNTHFNSINNTIHVKNYNINNINANSFYSRSQP